MIFYEEVWDKVKEGKEYGYTVQMCANLFGLGVADLRKLLYSKVITPSVSHILEQTLNRDFAQSFEVKYQYIYDNLASKYVLWYIDARFMGLPNFKYIENRVDMKKFFILKKLTKNKVIVNTIKVEMLIHVFIEDLINKNNLDFLRNANKSLKCLGYMEELRELANINRELFYKNMGVKRNDYGQRNDDCTGTDINHLDTSSINFKPSEVIKSKLQYGSQTSKRAYR